MSIYTQEERCLDVILKSIPYLVDLGDSKAVTSSVWVHTFATLVLMYIKIVPVYSHNVKSIDKLAHVFTQFHLDTIFLIGCSALVTRGLIAPSIHNAATISRFQITRVHVYIPILILLPTQDAISTNSLVFCSSCDMSHVKGKY